MRHLTRSFLMLSITLLLIGSVFLPWSNATGRSFKECQALAVSRGVSVRYTGKVVQRHERYKADSGSTKPKGFITRCMAGLD